MRLALLHPEPEKGGRGKKALETSGFSRQRLGQARAVLAFSRELALAVRDGFKTLDAALAEAKAARDAEKQRDRAKSKARDCLRRHADRFIKAGQRAILVALLHPEPEKGGRGQNRKETLQFSKMRLSQARAIVAMLRRP